MQFYMTLTGHIITLPDVQKTSESETMEEMSSCVKGNGLASTLFENPSYHCAEIAGDILPDHIQGF